MQKLTKQQAQQCADIYLLIQQTLGEYFTLAEDELIHDPTFTGFVSSYAQINEEDCPIFYFNSVSYAYDVLPNDYIPYIADSLQAILAKHKNITLNQLLAEPFTALIFDNYLFVQHLQSRFYTWEENGKQLVRLGPAQQ